MNLGWELAMLFPVNINPVIPRTLALEVGVCSENGGVSLTLSENWDNQIRSPKPLRIQPLEQVCGDVRWVLDCVFGT